MTNAGKWILAAALLSAPILHAQEDEDDPKGAPHRPATIAPKPRPKPAEAKPEPKAVEAPVRRAATATATTTTTATPEKAQKAPEAKPAPIAKPTTNKPTPVEPAAKIATVGATNDGSIPNPARTVRVRLADGSQVVGLVHAEESDVLIIDCALGQLAIPRSRISTIAYDAAAGAGSKHAPVQQLDDDDRLPARKRVPAP